MQKQFTYIHLPSFVGDGMSLTMTIYMHSMVSMNVGMLCRFGAVSDMAGRTARKKSTCKVCTLLHFHHNILHVFTRKCSIAYKCTFALLHSDKAEYWTRRSPAIICAHQIFNLSEANAA